MNIKEATKKALKTDGMMYRTTECPEGERPKIAIKPTESYDLCQLFVFSNGRQRCCREWNPKANDLMAEDWEVLCLEGQIKEEV